MRWVREALLQALASAQDRAATPLEALAALFRAHVEFVVAHPGVPRLVFHELQQAADSPAKREVRALLQAYRKRLLDLLAQADAPGHSGRAPDAEAAATAFIGLVQGLVMQSMLTGRAAGMRQQADPVFALYLRGLGVAA